MDEERATLAKALDDSARNRIAVRRMLSVRPGSGGLVRRGSKLAIERRAASWPAMHC